MRSAIEGAHIAVALASGLWTEASGAAFASFLRLKTWQSTSPDVVGCQERFDGGGRAEVVAVVRGGRVRARAVTGCDGLKDGGQRLVDMRSSRPP
jgi:hypothetical protein